MSHSFKFSVSGEEAMSIGPIEDGYLMLKLYHLKLRLSREVTAELAQAIKTIHASVTDTSGKTMRQGLAVRKENNPAYISVHSGLNEANTELGIVVVESDLDGVVRMTHANTVILPANEAPIISDLIDAFLDSEPE